MRSTSAGWLDRMKVQSKTEAFKGESRDTNQKDENERGKSPDQRRQDEKGKRKGEEDDVMK